jgi:ubiquinone biosynthesis protein
MGLGAYFRLIRAGYVLAREGALSIADNAALPPVMKAGVKLGRMLERREVRGSGRAERLTRALNRLGPTYVKLGQTLATRPDIVGAEVAADLSVLQDAMDPFDPALVPGLLSDAIGARARELSDISPPIAAASIAQVHHARLPDGTKVAVKILRPGVRQRFADDIESQYAGAKLAETFVPKLRRLRPFEIVGTLDRSSRIELDLRMEAASISELADNIKDDAGFVIPSVLWDYTSDTVLTTTWVEGIPIRDHAALDAAGADRKALATNLLQAFLRHAVRDGFFHADLHPGNLFADPGTNDIVAVDFGIMGRINRRERRFLAEILYGFITRNYRLIAQRHFDIGYVPKTQSVEEFALALRAIGEPQHGRRVADISMAKVLGQLFQTTELFQMRARPELILLQKSMVLVEGVARALDPQLDIWSISEPIVGDWVRREAGPLGRLEDLKDHFDTAVATFGRLPELVGKAEVALEDYEREKRSPDRRFNRFMVLTGFWVGLAVLLVALWRLLGL